MERRALRMDRRGSTWHGTARFVALAVLALVSACDTAHEPATPGTELSAIRRDSAGVTILTLSHTLAEVAAGQTRAELIEPDLLVGESGDDEDVWFGAVADVMSLGRGSFAVLDHMEARIMLIDSLGRLSSTIGREGDGPGEFKWPWALSTVGTSTVVRQNNQNQIFTILNEDGSVRAVAPADPEGDWFGPKFRYPRFHHLGFPMGPEDVTRRLQPFDTVSFIHMLQVNEMDHWDFVNPTEFEVTPTFLIRYDLAGLVLDTLAVLPGPPTYVHHMWVGQTFFYTQRLYPGTPVWTTGEGWYAIGHGDSTEVVVRDTHGDILLRIRTPPRRRGVSASDKVVAANWVLTGPASFNQAAIARAREDPSAFKRGQERLIHDPTHGIHFADSVPMISAVYGAGKCLFLSGYRPEDWPDGTSLTWVVIDVKAGRVLRTFRLRPPPDGTLPEEKPFKPYTQYGAATRDIDGDFAFTYLRMSDGAPAVERYPLSLACKG